MSLDAKQQQTTVNVQEKANLIWAIADKLFKRKLTLFGL